MPGVVDARALPDQDFEGAWQSVIFPSDFKERLVRLAAVGVQLRARVAFEALPLHGVMLFTGQPGVGKTTLARGLADKVARTVSGLGTWSFIEVDPHALASSSLGRSQRSVEQLFGSTLDELAQAGPLVVLLDEVETLATNRAALSLEANPVDVVRAIDAALVGLDRLARRFPHVLVLATSNFPSAIDPALASRADEVIEVPLPDRDSRIAILRDTIEAVAASFPGAKKLSTDHAALEAVAAAADGLDGRKLRKAVAAACALRAENRADPGRVTGEDLLAVVKEWTR
jgi:AAA+ superfamily predicted ATPase